ncbi:aldehyde dehydrogenase (NADP(+)) [Robertkochia solimangrovi]|uniref:aldehyde dehydrogenase (NADP(+)) n=1 Tax=Robertkochia solimangrovi TaxID=2213046 RepID=UPI00117EAD03|nr:aldehyde dehydrogenase (NADP(+)) [Robertkochia solimangrovi]TRZ46305.1 aldehyde dehydrogenase (NADP(+)) [Robertkochia solimangrovi]
MQIVNQIGFKKSAQEGKVFKTYNPVADRENEWEIIEATTTEVDEAVSKAITAFADFSTRTGEEKAKFLEAIAEAIEAIGEELIETYMAESGLPRGRAEGERGRTIGQLKAFAAQQREGSWVEAIIDKGNPDRKPMPKPDLRKMLVPMGPVAVFGASNFPFAFSTAGGDTASALAAGCPVVVKSHPMHAATAGLVSGAIASAAKATGMPDGVFSNLNSKDHTVGEALVMHPGIKAVGFTGSFRGGMALYKLAANREEPIPVFAEMGSINPVLLLPSVIGDPTPENWAGQIAGSVNLGAGQFCTNPGLLIGIKGEGWDDFSAALTEAISAQQSQCMLHPAIWNSFKDGKSTIAGHEHVKLLAASSSETKANFGEVGLYTINASDFLSDHSLQTEVFGPFSLLVACENAAEMKTVIEALEGQLTGSVLGNPAELNTFAPQVKALESKVGRLNFNSLPTGVEVCESMNHGGPFPATTDSRFTSVGLSAIKRWVRPVSFQNWPQEALPDALKDENPLQIQRKMN